VPLLPQMPSNSENYLIGGRVSQPGRLREEARWPGDEEHSRPGKAYYPLDGAMSANERTRLIGANLRRERAMRRWYPRPESILYE
jgi:hypothetical protein